MKIYKINVYYIKFLMSLDNKVMWPKEYRYVRPYIGIIIDIDFYTYFAPLTTNRQNKNNWSIINLDRVAGSIFLTNMIPVPKQYINEIVSILDIDKYFFSLDNEDASYGLKLFGQLELLQETKLSETIIKKSKKIYRLQKFSPFYRQICCNYPYLEKMSHHWIESFWYLIFIINQYSQYYHIV